MKKRNMIYKIKRDRKWGDNNVWDWVLAAIITIMVIGTCSSCSQKTLPAPSVTVKEKIVERIIKDTVTISLPSERVEVVRKDSSMLQTKLAVSTAKILEDGSLLHTLENKPTLPVQVEHKETIVTKDSIVKEPYPVPGKDVVKYKQRWYEEMFMWIGVAAFILFLIVMLARWFAPKV